MARPAVLTVADTIARSFLRPWKPAATGRRSAKRNSASGSRPVGASGCRSPRTSPTPCMPSASGPATSPRSSPTRCRNGSMPTWASCAPAAFRPASIRPIRRPRSNISINDSSTRVIFAEDEEQLDKILSCRSRCPTLQKIIVFDMEGLSGFTDPMVLSLAEFMALGRNHAQGNEALWDEMIGSRSADDLAILVYTSGTTGPPKGAMHSNRSVDASDAPRQRSVSVDRQRRAAGVPAALPRRRADRRLLHLAGAGIGDEFRRKPGNRAGQSARGAADRVPRGAADLGEILFRHHDRAEGRDRRSRTGCTATRLRSAIA